MFWSARSSLLRAEGFSGSLDVLYEGLRISKLQFLIKKSMIIKKLQLYFFLQFLTSKPWIRIWISLEMLDPDPQHRKLADRPTWSKHAVPWVDEPNGPAPFLRWGVVSVRLAVAAHPIRPRHGCHWNRNDISIKDDIHSRLYFCSGVFFLPFRSRTGNLNFLSASLNAQTHN